MLLLHRYTFVQSYIILFIHGWCSTYYVWYVDKNKSHLKEEEEDTLVAEEDLHELALMTLIIPILIQLFFFSFFFFHNTTMINTKWHPFTTYFLSKHCNSLSDGCVTKRTSGHSRYIGSTISTQTKMIARTKQDGLLSILTDHTKMSFIYQSGL